MVTFRRRLTQDDVDRIGQTNAVREAYFQRDPDRPDARFVKPRGRAPIEVRRAQQRLRTARWRSDMDRCKAPTLDQIGRSLAVALVTSTLDELTVAEARIIERALNDLKAREFDIDEAKVKLRRLRNKLVPAIDRRGEATADGLPF